MEPISDRELARICHANVYEVVTDDLRMPREVEAATVHVVETYEQVVNQARRGVTGGASCRDLLPRYTLLVGEVIRLWSLHADTDPPGEALERCRAAWQRLRTTGEHLREGEDGRARKRLDRFRSDLPRLQRQAYRVTGETRVMHAILGHQGAWEVFARHGLRCRGCWVGSRERLADAARCHPFDEESLLRDLRALVAPEDPAGADTI